MGDAGADRRIRRHGARPTRGSRNPQPAPAARRLRRSAKFIAAVLQASFPLPSIRERKQTHRASDAKGFPRDHSPEAMIPRERLIDTARRVYRSYGFSPIDTPALEYLEILSGKGSDETDKQLYKFQDHGGRWVGLRFDLTVPLARFAAQHANESGTPLKRYHIATVRRARIPNAAATASSCSAISTRSAPWRWPPTSKRCW